MFEVLFSAMQRDQVRFVDDGFFLFNANKDDLVTCTAFFATTPSAAHVMIDELGKIAAGRPIKVTANVNDALEIKALEASGFVFDAAKPAKELSKPSLDVDDYVPDGVLGYWVKGGSDAPGDA